MSARVWILAESVIRHPYEIFLNTLLYHSGNLEIIYCSMYVLSQSEVSFVIVIVAYSKGEIHDILPQ